MKGYKNFKAFTLAEVLITLAIIGVVAAITIPAVMNKIGYAQKSAGVKKGMSIISNAYNAAKSENGGSFECLYAKDSNGNIIYPAVRSECNLMWGELKNQFKASKTCDGSLSANYFGECLPQNGIDDINVTCNGFQKNYQKITNSILFPDGTYLFQYKNDVDYYPLFAYDINGFKTPNKFGDDVFVFQIIDYKMVPSTCYNPGERAADFISGTK